MTVYPRSLLFAMTTQYFNEGLLLLRIFCFKDLYKRVYRVEPATLQMYSTIVYLPGSLKALVGVIIDTKTVSRKGLFVVFGLNTVIAQALISLGMVDSECGVLAALVVLNLGIAILDATIDSMVVEQARCHKRGQQDLQSFGILTFGLGTSIGSIVTYFLTEWEKPIWGYGFGAIVGVLITITALFTDPELETNEYATVKDAFLERYEDEQRRLHPNTEVVRPNCCVLLGLKFRAACSAMAQPLILKFYAFSIVWALVMPSFDDFDYYFAIEVLNIPASWIAL